MASTSSQIRLLLVEDVAQVAQYIRNLLNAQDQVKLLDVISDGRHVIDQIREVRPDILMVDALLQGKVNGLEVAERVRQAGFDLPIITLTVPQKPIKIGPGMGVVQGPGDAVLRLRLHERHPGGQRRVQGAVARSLSRTYTVFAPKGGVGKTTIAFNLAVAMGQIDGLKVVLIDGNLQFGDLRALLRVPETAPSVLQLPTDRISESDLQEVLWRDPSGIDILLAPPRVEMAEMVTTRDLEKALSLLKRVYNIVIIDTPTTLNDAVLAVPRRERRDPQRGHLRLDHHRQHAGDGADVPGDRLSAGEDALRGQPLGLDRRHRPQGAGRADRPATGVRDRQRRPPGGRGQQPGHPLRARRSRSAQISQDIVRMRQGADRPVRDRARRSRPPVSGGSTLNGMPDARPIGFFDSGVGGLTVLREVLRRLPRESTIYLGDNARAPYGPRSDDEVIRFSGECLDELAARDVKAIVVACNTSSAVALGELRRRYDVPILGVVRPGASAAALSTRSRRVGVIATQATVRSHAYFQAIKDENPFVEVYEHATPELVPLVEAGFLEGADGEAAVVARAGAAHR